MRKFTLVTVLVLSASSGACRAQEKHYAFVGARLLPIAGDEIDRGVLIVSNGKITAVGAMDRVTIPAGAKRIDADARRRSGRRAS